MKYDINPNNALFMGKPLKFDPIHLHQAWWYQNGWWKITPVDVKVKVEIFFFDKKRFLNSKNFSHHLKTRGTGSKELQFFNKVKKNESDYGSFWVPITFISTFFNCNSL